MSFFGLSIAGSALDAFQDASDTTSNNIANVNTATVVGNIHLGCNGCLSDVAPRNDTIAAIAAPQPIVSFSKY